jgi:hypothetical protein
MCQRLRKQRRVREKQKRWPSVSLPTRLANRYSMISCYISCYAAVRRSCSEHFRPTWYILLYIAMGAALEGGDGLQS